MILGPKTPLEDATAFVNKHARDGVNCPCCGRLVKIYRRRLHREMASFIVRLVQAYQSTRRPVSTRDLNPPGARKASTDGSFLKHWGLVTCETPGYYVPTEDGIAFALDTLQVSAYVELLNGEPVHFSDETVSVVDALGSSFNYDELMRSIR